MINKLFHINILIALFLCCDLSANEMDEPMLDSATIPPHIATMRPEAPQAIFPSLEQPQVSSGSVLLNEDALPTLRLTTDSFMTEALSHRAEWKNNLESRNNWEQFAEDLASRLMKANYSGVTLAALWERAKNVSEMTDNIENKTFLRKLGNAYQRIYRGNKPSAIPLNNKERQRKNRVTKFTSHKRSSSLSVQNKIFGEARAQDAPGTFLLTNDIFKAEALSQRAEWKSNLESLTGWEQFAEGLASRLRKANYFGVTLAALQTKAFRVLKKADNIKDKTFLRELRNAYNRIYAGKKPSAIPLNNKERQRTNGVTKFTYQKPNSLRPLSPTLSFEAVVQELGLDLESVGDQPSYGYDELANMLGVEI